MSLPRGISRSAPHPASSSDSPHLRFFSGRNKEADFNMRCTFGSRCHRPAHGTASVFIEPPAAYALPTHLVHRRHQLQFLARPVAPFSAVLLAFIDSRGSQEPAGSKAGCRRCGACRATRFRRRSWSRARGVPSASSSLAAPSHGSSSGAGRWLPGKPSLHGKKRRKTLRCRGRMLVKI